jgi:hypothetical protein
MRRLFAVAGVAAVAGFLLFSYTPDARSLRDESDLKSHGYYENRDHHIVHTGLLATNGVMLSAS